MSANDTQVGGDHYKLGGKGEEHWDRVWRMHGRGYFVGCITKYVERYHLKNGLQDLQKARHFLDKLIELESTGIGANAPTVSYEQWMRETQAGDKYVPSISDKDIIVDGVFMDGTETCRCLKCGMIARGKLDHIRRIHDCQAKT